MIDSWFSDLVSSTQERIYGLCLKYLGSADEAEDTTQETFLKAYRNRDSFRHDARPETWLYRIALNLCHDHYRRRKKIKMEHIADREFADHDRTQENLEQKELMAMIRRATDGLSEKHRLVFTLREFEGLSYQEIAEIAGCSIGTVESRLFHARNRIREKLAGEGYP